MKVLRSKCNKEQFFICFRQVDKGFDIHEDFIRIYKVDNIKADTLVKVIKYLLIRFNYDGVKMRLIDIKNDVSIEILSENPKTFFAHCFGHALNLSVRDMVKNVRFLKESIDKKYVILHGHNNEISNLIKKSTIFVVMLQKIQKNLSLEYPGFRVLCPARWTVKG